MTNDELIPLQPGNWDQAITNVIDDMHGVPLKVHCLMANNPSLLKSWWPLRNYVVHGGALGQRRCELVILRVAVQMGCWYEWASHVARAIACGVSISDIEKIQNDPKQADWGSADKAILIAVDELIATHALSADTRKEMHQHFSAEQLLDLIAIQGTYVMLGCMINTWGLELDEAVARQLPANVSQEVFERNHPRQ